LSKEDRRLLNELIEEHVIGRKTTKKLIEANNRYRHGDESALAVERGEIIARKSGYR
jgi:hypothetical protein